MVSESLTRGEEVNIDNTPAPASPTPVNAQDDHPSPSSSAKPGMDHGVEHQRPEHGMDPGDQVLEGLFRGLPDVKFASLGRKPPRYTPKGSKEEAWRHCFKLVETHDKDLCQTYREQIDTLLVFAGLFSAVVTAFSVESYQWLQDDPNEISAELLQQLVTLLSTNHNGTQSLPIRRIDDSNLSANLTARINLYWFVSLFLSLSAALVAIVCKQWVREFERDIGQSHEEAVAVRQVKFEGLEYWRLGDIVSSVPLLLQLALALFMIGILELLWRLHTGVAAATTIVAALTGLFYIATSLVPFIQSVAVIARSRLVRGDIESRRSFSWPQSPFKSVQSWLVLRAMQPLLARLKLHPVHDADIPLKPLDSWIAFDVNWKRRRDVVADGPPCSVRALAWLADTIGETHINTTLWHCLWGHLALWRKKNPAVGCGHLGYIIQHSKIDRSLRRLSLPPNVDARAETHLLYHSIRSEMSVNTATELFLRIYPVLGQGTPQASSILGTMAGVFQEAHDDELSEDLAVALVRLLQRTRWPLRCGRQVPAAYTFAQAMFLLGSKVPRSSHVLLPAVCAIALRWLRSIPFDDSPAHVRSLINDVLIILEPVLSYYDNVARLDPERLRRLPGIEFPAGIAGFIIARKPDVLKQPCGYGECFWQLAALSGANGRVLVPGGGGRHGIYCSCPENGGYRTTQELVEIGDMGPLELYLEAASL